MLLKRATKSLGRFFKSQHALTRHTRILLPFYFSTILTSNPGARIHLSSSCLDPIEASLWCGTGSIDGGDDDTSAFGARGLIVYKTEEGNPYVVACCRKDFCRIGLSFPGPTFNMTGSLLVCLSFLI